LTGRTDNGRGGDPMNILLVEDSDSEVFLLEKFLAQRPPAPDVRCVADGEQALDYLFHRNGYDGAMPPDAALLALGLPRVTDVTAPDPAIRCEAFRRRFRPARC
jgi:chemotaxis family two-component system response regulator Rcp1